VFFYCSVSSAWYVWFSPFTPWKHKQEFNIYNMSRRDVNMSCSCFNSLGLEECPVRMEMQIHAFCCNKCHWACFTSYLRCVENCPYLLFSISFKFIQVRQYPFHKVLIRKTKTTLKKVSIHYFMLSLFSVIFPAENYVLTCSSFLKIKLYWLKVDIKALQ